MSVRRHTAYNIAGAGVPLLATFITLPIYLQTIGEERYGILIILWTLLGYFGLFDLGLGRAVTNRIAMFKDRTALEREQVFWTALLINVSLGCAGAIVLWSSGSVVFRHFVDVTGSLADEVYTSLPWMVMAFPLLLTSGVLTGALTGRKEFLAENAVRIATGLLIQILPLIVAIVVGPALPALVFTVLAIRLLSALSLFGLCIRLLPIQSAPRLTRSHVRPLFGFGGWVTVTSVIGPLLTTLDRVIIGALAGVRAVTYYTVPFDLASRISLIPGSLSSALFPRFSASGSSERNALLGLATRSLLVVVTPLAVLGMLIMEPFLTWWVGAAFAAEAAPIGEILTIGLWANCLAYIPFAEIQGRGRPDLAAKFHLAELLPYLAILWLALEWKGAVGAAVVWSLRVWVDAALMFWATQFRNPRVFLIGGSILIFAFSVVVLTSGSAWDAIAVRSCTGIGTVIWAWHSAPENLRDLVLRTSRRIDHAEAT